MSKLQTRVDRLEQAAAAQGERDKAAWKAVLEGLSSEAAAYYLTHLPREELDPLEAMSDDELLAFHAAAWDEPWTDRLDDALGWLRAELGPHAGEVDAILRLTGNL